MDQIKINPENILSRLHNGESREEIRVDLGLSKSDAKLMFQHPILKNQKTRKTPGFVFVEDNTQDSITSHEEIDVTNPALTDEELISMGEDRHVATIDDDGEVFLKENENNVWD